MVENIGKIKNALRAGQGAIVYSCHIGPYYLLPAALSLSGYPTVAVEKIGVLETLLAKRKIGSLNRDQGCTLLQTQSAYEPYALRRMVRHLREGKIVFVMGDYHGDRDNSKSRNTTFMGYDVIPGRAIAWLHAKTNAPVFPLLPSYGHGKRQFVVFDELALDKHCDPCYVTQRVYRTIEEVILQRPEEWVLWMDYHMMLARNQDTDKASSGAKIPSPANEGDAQASPGTGVV